MVSVEADDERQIAVADDWQLQRLTSHWLARPYSMVPMSRSTCPQRPLDQLHEDPLSFKQSSSYGLFLCLHYSFSYCYFLVVHLHRVATFELSQILTNTLNNLF